MIKDGFYWCDKGHKLQQITEQSMHIGTFYCRHCDKQYEVRIVGGNDYTNDCIEFENAMNRIKDVVGTTDDELIALRDKAIKLSEQLK